jgi:hypothetical protein
MGKEFVSFGQQIYEIEQLERTMRIEMRRKYAFAMRRNWSHSDFGSHVYHVYLVVEILFAAVFVDPTSELDIELKEK